MKQQSVCMTELATAGANTISTFRQSRKNAVFSGDNFSSLIKQKSTMIIVKAFCIAVKNAQHKKSRQCNCEQISSDLQVLLLPLPPSTIPRPRKPHSDL